MTPKEYQNLANRTECSQTNALSRLIKPHRRSSTVEDIYDMVRLNHSVIGIAGEAGELAAIIERCVYYGQTLDIVGFKEELGDLLWYIAEACNELGLDMTEVMEANIRKLRTRYPEKYSDQSASEENRNRPAEQAAINTEGLHSIDSKELGQRFLDCGKENK